MVFFSYRESADTFSPGTKKHHKRCSCVVIKGRLYVVLTLRAYCLSIHIIWCQPKQTHFVTSVQTSQDVKGWFTLMPH